MRRTKAIVLSVCAASVAVFLAPTGLAAIPRQAREVSVRPCPGLDRVLCGSIEVPLYRDRPGVGDITVRFRIYEHTDREGALEPIVAMEGGPGYGSIGSAFTYRFLLGPLRGRHDLIVMDQRGTGSSEAINCPGLQLGVGRFVRAAAECARRLGPAAGAFGTAAVADDLHDILVGLGVPTVDLYGDSYGTYVAQVFALHHPEQVRAVVLDGAFHQSFDPFEREAPASLRHAWRALCRRATTCAGPILARIRRLDRTLARHPLGGSALDADGRLRRVHLTAAGFAQLVFDATYSYTVFRDLPAALESLRSGDAAPVLRLAAEDASLNAAGGSPRAYSVGDYMAVSCHDYPTAWDPAADIATRRRQLAGAIAGIANGAFAPFPKDVWLRSPTEHQLVRGCLRWPRPTIDDPAFPPDVEPTDVPVLVLNGEFDQATPIADARAAAAFWPGSFFVPVANTAHISALYDFRGCATTIVRLFLRTLHPAGTSCASTTPDVNVMPAFPTRLARAPMAEPRTAADASRPVDRRAAWVATWTIGDALARWYNLMYSRTGAGMRGGEYTVRGPYTSRDPLRIVFHGARLVVDAAVSARMEWDRRMHRVVASLRIRGPGGLAGALTITFSTDERGAGAAITGVIGGRTVDLVTLAPWSSQG